MSIEVEQKFHCDQEAERRLVELGARLTTEVTQRDVYYDTANYTLTCADHWLRQRNGQWELKCPPEEKHAIGNSTQYREYNDATDIAGVVTKTLEGPSSSGSHMNMDELLHKFSVSPFADITTKRRKYTLNGIAIDLDETDYGYNLGEIEVITDNASISDAYDQIKQFASRLGVETTQYVPGKVLVYLWRFRRPHFEALLQAKVTRAPPEQLVRDVLDKL